MSKSFEINKNKLCNPLKERFLLIQAQCTRNRFSPSGKFILKVQVCDQKNRFVHGRLIIINGSLEIKQCPHKPSVIWVGQLDSGFRVVSIYHTDLEKLQIID